MTLLRYVALPAETNVTDGPITHDAILEVTKTGGATKKIVK